VIVNANVLYHSSPGLASARAQFVLYRGKSIVEFMSDLLKGWGGAGFGFVLFETEEQARAANPNQSSWSVPGVTILCGRPRTHPSVLTNSDSEPKQDALCSKSHDKAQQHNYPQHTYSDLHSSQNSPQTCWLMHWLLRSKSSMRDSPVC
jgi:hypothetical protein